MDPPTHIKKLDAVRHTCRPNPGEARQKDPRTCWPPSVAKLVGLRVTERACLKNKMKSGQGRLPVSHVCTHSVNTGSCTQMHIYINTCIHTHKEAKLGKDLLGGCHLFLGYGPRESFFPSLFPSDAVLGSSPATTYFQNNSID